MKGTLEKTIFRFTLILAIVYQLYQVINGLFSGATTTILNASITVLFGIIFLLTFKVSNIKYLAFFLHLAVIPILIHFWKNFGGLAGTVPLILFVYASWIILTLRGWLQIIMLGIYLVVFLVLTELPSLTGIPVTNPEKLSIFQLSIDYFVVALILMAFLMYLKNKFLAYRKRIEHRHEQLQKLTETLLKQTDKLQYSQEEIRSINENLEQIIEQRIKKIEERNVQLEEYAFINAHLVRGPLCRIIGLAVLMQQEQADPQLATVQEKARQVDVLIRRINEITR